MRRVLKLNQSRNGISVGKGNRTELHEGTVWVPWSHPPKRLIPAHVQRLQKYTAHLRHTFEAHYDNHAATMTASLGARLRRHHW